MGTSRGYQGPTGGGWTPLKRLVGQFGQGVANAQPGAPTAGQVLARYVGQLGAVAAGALAAGAGGGGGGGGGSARAAATMGPAIVDVGRGVGGFAGSVGAEGLAEALRALDLADLVGRPAGEVAVALLDRLAGANGTMDEQIARMALDDLQRELLGEAQTFEEVEAALTAAVAADAVEGLLMDFYGYALFHQFSRDYFEDLQAKIGLDAANQCVDEVRATIVASLEAKVADRDTSAIDWAGAEGRELAETILRETLTIFSVPT